MPGLTMEVAICEMRLIAIELEQRGIEIEPCMRSSDLLDFERSHLLRFPAGYRMYLLEIGNGIKLGNDSACKEILPLGQTPLGYPLSFSDLLKNIHKPFPYEKKSLVDEEGDSSDEEEEYNENRLKHRDIGGYLTLGTSSNSCDHFWILICEGNCRGEVWIVTWYGSFFPCTPRMTFRDWLEDLTLSDGYKLEQSLLNTHNYPVSDYLATSAALTIRRLVTSVDDHNTDDEEEEEESMSNNTANTSFFTRYTRSFNRISGERRGTVDSLEYLRNYNNIRSPLSVPDEFSRFDSRASFMQ